MEKYQEFEIDFFQDEDGMFNAEVPAIRGCVAWGKPLKECYRNAVEAIESCLEAREEILRKIEEAKAKAALQEQASNSTIS
jgi:predicted RNase H-like HicB family nuclease